MKNIIFFSFAICLVIISFSACDDKDDPQPKPNITNATELTSALAEIHQNSAAPAFALSVVKNDQLLYQQAFGQADIDNNIAYTNQTVQPIGSISKTFVAAALVKAIEQGHFTLETDINDILPVDIVNPKQPNATISVKELVTHTSSLLDNVETYFEAYHILLGQDLSGSGAEILQNAFGFEQRGGVPLEDFLANYYLEDGDDYNENNFGDYAPGSTWNYSNIATSLTAYLIESATAMDFKNYVKTYILEPLDMNNTTYNIDEVDPAYLAQWYWDKDTPLPKYANDSYPDGSINTNNKDLAKYMMDMMKGVKGQSTSLFSKESYDLLFYPLLTDGMLPSFAGDNQSIFWFFKDDYIKHDGSDPGICANMQFDQTGETGYCFITNMDASSDEHQNNYHDLASKINDAVQQFLMHN